ncbi:MAG: tol-pal system YbgF family protein, partial [Sandaracinaceae bacterium]
HDSAARAHFEEGTRLFEVGEYGRAAAEFQAAYDLVHHPDLLFNVYSALERQGDLEGAARALEAYLHDSPAELERRDALEARLARLQARIAENELARRDEAAAREEGAHAEPTSTSGGGVHPAGIGVLIAGGVLLATFGVFAGLSAMADGQLADTCMTSCSEEQVSDLRTFALIADIAWISGAVVAVTGLVLLFVLPPEGEAASATLAPWITPDGGGAVLVGRL